MLLLVLPFIAICSVVLLIIYSKFLFKTDQPLRIARTQLKQAAYVDKRRMLKVDKATLRANYRSSYSLYVTYVLSAILLWVTWQITSMYTQDYPLLKPMFILFGAYTLFLSTLAAISKPYKINRSQQSRAQRKSVAILVPVYNEDPEALRSGLRSMITQYHMPHEIHVVDDGSTTDYKKIRTWFYVQARACNVRVTWYRQNNSGKRAAQINAYSRVDKSKTDYIATVDSDCELDPRALEESIKPFVNDKNISSVAGVVIAKNAQHNMLARITDLIFVSGQQLIDRAGMSQLGSVIVNSGGLALYKSRVVQNAIRNDYDNEIFMGRQVKFSDDSYLTLIAKMMGKTVQQQSAIVFSDMPVRLSHHVRQQVRWGRGSFIRGIWRLRYLPFVSWGVVRQVSGWVVFALMTAVQIDLFIISPIIYDKFIPVAYLLIPILFMYFTSLRYFSIKRSDMSFSSQVYTYSLAIFAIVWTALVLRIIRLYAIFTCAKTGWGTRAAVEITYEETPQTAII